MLRAAKAPFRAPFSILISIFDARKGRHFSGGTCAAARNLRHFSGGTFAVVRNLRHFSSGTCAAARNLRHFSGGTCAATRGGETCPERAGGALNFLNT